VLVDELLRGPTQQKTVLVVGLDLAQEPNPVDQINRDRNVALRESTQELILKHPGLGRWHESEHPTPSGAWQAILFGAALW
jgi:hypothetical protein